MILTKICIVANLRLLCIERSNFKFYLYMKNPLYTSALVASLGGLGCANQQYLPVGAHIPERGTPTLSDALRPLPDKYIELADPAVDLTLTLLFKTYGDAANRVVDYCLGKSNERNGCPAKGIGVDPLQFWHLADMNDSTDYSWAGTDENGARKCNLVLNACLKQELVNPMSLGAAPIKVSNHTVVPPVVLQSSAGIKLDFPYTDTQALPVIFARNDVAKDLVRGNDRIQACLEQASTNLPEDALKIFKEAKVQAGSDELFWLRPKIRQDGWSTENYLLSGTNTRILAVAFKACLKE